MNIYKNKVLIVFLLCLGYFAFSQDPYFKIIDKVSGLPSNTVYDVLQNKEGFVFFATDKGLVKYDGVNFIKYSNPSKSSKALSNLIEIDNGEVYCQNFIGEIFYTENENLIPEKYLPPSGNYYAMRKFNNQIAAFANDTLKVFNYKTKAKTKILSQNKILVNVYADDNEIICLNLTYDVCFFNGKEWNKIYKNKNEFFNNAFFIEKINNGYVFIKKFDNQNVSALLNEKPVKLNGIKDSVFINRVKTINNIIWVCSTSGIYLFDQNFKPLNQNKALFKNFSVSNVIQDKEGAFWISTIDKGIIYVPNMDVKVFGKDEYQFSCISKSTINKKLLLGTYNNQIVNFDLLKQNTNLLYNLGYSNEVNSVVFDSINNCLIIGSSHLFLIKNNKVIFKQIMGVKDIRKTAKGKLLVAYASGSAFFKPPVRNLNYLSPVGNEIVNNNNMLELLPKLNYRTRAIETSSNDSLIFIANSKGLFSRSELGVSELLYNDSSIIASCLKLNGNQLLIGTFNNGILKYDIKDNNISKIKIQNLIVKQISKIYTHKNVIYFINEDGLFSYDTINKSSHFWNVSDGVNSDSELKDVTIIDNTIYIASNQGLISLPLNCQSKNTTAPNLVFNFFSQNFNSKDSVITLNYPNNDLLIKFSVLSFKGNDSVKVYYKINNDNWLRLNNRERQLKLSYLAPGKYQIQFKVINEDGVEYLNPKIIKLYVNPPFYQKWWFIVLLVCVSISVGLLINKYRLKKIIERQKSESDKRFLKQQLDLSSLKTLRAQMNPHFIFNALNSIQSYVYSGEKEKAGKYLSLFSDLSRSLLNNSSEHEVNLYEEIKLIDLYLQLECIRLPKISYKIIKDEAIKLHDTYIPAMILQPIVENAVKHGLSNKSGNGYVEVRFVIITPNLIIEIEDDGIGRSNSKVFNNRILNKPDSFATKAIEDRISLLNKNKNIKIEHIVIDKYNTDGTSSGTLVKLIIPLNYD